MTSRPGKLTKNTGRRYQLDAGTGFPLRSRFYLAFKSATTERSANISAAVPELPETEPESEIPAPEKLVCDTY